MRKKSFVDRFKNHKAYLDFKQNMNYRGYRAFINEGETVIRCTEGNQSRITPGLVMEYPVDGGTTRIPIRIVRIKHVMPMNGGCWVCVDYVRLTKEEIGEWNSKKGKWE